MKSFEELEVWQASRLLVIDVYKLFAFLTDYAFKDQITKATVSIINNIAEGHERESPKEYARFLRIAKGSCGEVRSMLIIASDLDYISEIQKETLSDQCLSISRQLSGFVKYLSDHS